MMCLSCLAARVIRARMALKLFFPVEYAQKVWEGLLNEGASDGVTPIGLAARDSLRFEACMPLYGQELNAVLTPVNTRLNFAVQL